MKVVLIDGNSLLFRAYYATAYAGTSNIMRRKDGFPTNAIYSLANIVQKIISTENPDYGFVAFDTPKPTFRHLQFKDYKAGRKETPQELIDQFLPARELLKKFGFVVHEQEGYEADDLIGTVSKMAPTDMEVKIYSGDKDLLQLITQNCTVCLTKKGVTDLKCMTPEVLKEEMGVTPSQITDLKGLMGDKSDNIPGISGIGEKTAVKFLNQYGTLEKILEADISGKTGETIKNEKEQGLMSKQLATINTSVPVPFKFEDLKYTGLAPDLANFLNEYEMFSLMKKLPINMDSQTMKLEAKIVTKVPVEFYNKEISLALEIDGRNYHEDNIVGLGIATSSDYCFIQINDLVNDKDFINILNNENIKKNGFDIKRIICGLRRYGIEVKGFDFDILLATYLLNSLVNEEEFSIFAYYNKTINAHGEIFYRGNYELDKVAGYGSLQAKLISELKEESIKQLKELDLFNLLNDVEIPLAKILADMESKGILLDKELLANKSKEYKEILSRLEKEIFSLVGHEYNINSPSQTAEVLFDELHLPANRKRSTSAQELDFLKNFSPIPMKILEYRKYMKLLSVYSEGLPEFVLEDNRVHTIYNQALTQTGRLSSRDPNLQNIAARSEEGKVIRAAFVAKSGYKLISFDYSQIELRVLASIANVSSLIDAFNNNIDIHALTASKIFGLPLENVSKELRARAKTVNFGIVYGMSEFGLANEVGCSFKEAKEFIERYFISYPEIKEYYSRVVEECKANGYVKTLFNRRRYIHEINSSNFNQKELGVRLAKNTPVQGSAADIMKIAMIKVDKAIKENNLDCSMLLQVHDEIVCEVKESNVDKTIEIVKNALEDFKLKVKLEVDYNVNDSWYEE